MISLLDKDTISKIAAGEIIENPAAVIKELVENSIDAGAKNIIIESSKDPTEYLRVSDDGAGIAKDEIDLAFLRHSTSKLKKIEDLNTIKSLGFRGEALPSIASISKLKVFTKTEDDEIGTEANFINLKSTKKSIAMPKGTTIEIRDLFYNTPVRKKFLKNTNYELNLIYDVVQKIALSHPDISFTYIKDLKEVLNTRATSTENRIYEILGREISRNLKNVKFKTISYDISLFISNNTLFRASRNHHYIYVNNRFVRNLSISKEIERHYKSLIPLNKFPVFILYADIDPSLIDVNIHPKKHEIKLSKDSNFLAILGDMVNETLNPTRIIKKIENTKEDEKNIFEIFDDSNYLTENYNDSRSYSSYNLKDSVEFEVAEDEDSYEMDAPITNEFEIEDYEENKNYNLNNLNLFEDLNKDFKSIDKNLLKARYVASLFNTFIIFEDFKDETIFIIDQHAAHERILYEKYKKMYLASSISSQILVKPEILDLNADEYIKLYDNLDKFEKLGFEIEKIGEHNLILRSVPMIFGLPAYNDFIRDIINSLNNLNNSYEADLYKIMTKACKKAVKANDKLSIAEVNGLLRDLLNCENPYTCPHGRPTIIEYRKRDIEKLFLRD